MIIELTEEEREFLERICIRAKILAYKNIMKIPDDFGKIEILIEKLKKKNDSM